MVNQTKPPCVSGSNKGCTKAAVLLPAVHPPPCTRITVGNGPLPGGTWASSLMLTPAGRVNSTSRTTVYSSPAAKVMHAIVQATKQLKRMRIVRPQYPIRGPGAALKVLHSPLFPHQNGGK